MLILKRDKKYAFKELDNVTKDIFYASEEVRHWHGYRLLSIDGSRLILPNTKEILKEYGGQRLPETKEHTADILPASKFTDCYDVINNLLLDGILRRYDSYEVKQAKMVNIRYLN